MTQSSHTPGPWRVRRTQTPGQFVTSEKVCDAHNSVICNLHVNAEANGRLIAAAPKMLAALQQAEKALDSVFDGWVDGVIGEALLAVRIVIAEATGEERIET